MQTRGNFNADLSKFYSDFFLSLIFALKMESKNYRIVSISSPSETPRASILIIYSGGTIGMVDDSSGSLVSFNFRQILEKIPSLRTFGLKLTVISFPTPIDSSDINTNHWVDLGYIIHENYNQYDGFVILHGTDTMAFSASALSFVLRGLNKPVIFTGAQLPIGTARSDARENLITSLEIASTKIDGRPVVSEVCIYFGNRLLRGNRAKKVQSVHFDAFESSNYPHMADAGVTIEYNWPALKPPNMAESLVYKNNFDEHVAILKLFPGINKEMVRGILNIPKLRGVVMETYGSGNAPTEKWFLDSLKEAIDKGLIIFNVSQCTGGRVIQGRYGTSKVLKELGVLSGADITTEAAITKMMYLLGNYQDQSQVRDLLISPLSGEMAPLE